MLRIGRVILLVLAAQLLFAAPLNALAQPDTGRSKPDLARAKALILEGKGAEAWAMLEPYEFRLAGQPDLYKRL